jgi:hypothetical protein
MRTLTIALVVVLLTAFSHTQAKAENRAVEGLIIGTAVGSVVGLLVGSEMARDRYQPMPVYHRPVYRQPVVYAPPPPPPRPHYVGWERARHEYRHDYRPARACREIVVVRDGYGRHSKTVSTVCRTWR